MESRIFKAMGTTIKLQIYHDQADRLLEAAKNQLLDYEKRFSANNDQSNLMQINLAAGKEPVKVDADIFELIEYGKKFSMDETNTLNIAIGPLIKLWRIGFDDARMPTQAEIDDRLTRINPANIQLSKTNQTVYLEKAGMEIDLGSLAKGYFADKVKAFFIQAGVKHGIIDLGGNVLLIGDHPKNTDRFWRVGIQDPFETRNNTAGILKARDVSVVTSGIYERSFSVNGQEYHHIFDSQTGYPIQNDLASITIVSNESVTGELYTTMYYQHNSRKAIDRIENIPGIEAIIITRDHKVLITSGLADLFIVH